MQDFKKGDAAKGDVISRSYMSAGNTIGKYVGQEALFAPKKSAMKRSSVGPSPVGQGAGYSGLTSVY